MRSKRRERARLARAAVVAAAILVVLASLLPQSRGPWRAKLENALRGGSDGILSLRLAVDPRRLGAARLLDHGTGVRDHWWLPAVLFGHEGSFQVRARSSWTEDEAGSARSWQLRIEDGDALAGMRGFDLAPADPLPDARETLARRAARELGLAVAPSRFASLAVNGAPARLVTLRESPNRALFERIGLPPAELLVPLPATNEPRASAARFVPLLGSRDDDRWKAAAARLASLRALAEADELHFAVRIDQLVDIAQVLRWEGLKEALRKSDTSVSPLVATAWLSDPVSGRLAPWIDRDAASGADSAAVEAVLRPITARLLRHPAFARQRRLAREAVGALARRPTPADAGALARSLASFSPLPLRWFHTRDLAHTLDEQQAALTHALSGAEAEPRTVAAIRSPRAHSRSRSRSRANQAPEASARDLLHAELRRLDIGARIDDEAVVFPAGVHHLRRTLALPPEFALRIEPGATLALDPGVSLFANRALHAVGTPTAPIRITRAGNTAWGALGIARASELSKLAFVTVEGGSKATNDGVVFSGQLAFNASPIHIADSEIRGARSDGLSVRGGSFRVERSRFVDNRADGFDAEWAKGSVRDTLFTHNGDDGLDLATSEVSVDDCRFRGMGDKAISAGERSIAAVSGSELVDSPIAIVSKEESRVLVRSSEIRRNGIGLALYRDKAVFGTASGVVSDALFAENGRNFDVEAGSELAVDELGLRSPDAAASALSIGQQALR